MTPAPCPDCHTPLVKAAGEGVSWTCPSCGGRLLGLAPFENLLPEGEGAQMWVASAEGPQTAACPYCGLPMRSAPDGARFCRLCQEVWLPSGFALPASTQPGVPLAPQLPSQCQNCGAALEPDEMGRCKYCHAQVTAPQPIVVEMTAPGGRPSSGSRLVDGLVGLLTDPIG